MKEEETGRARVTITTEGRSGGLRYEGAEGSFSTYWEFGGGDTLAIIDVPSASRWEAQTGIPLEKRMDILHFIGRKTVASQTTDGKGRYVILDSCIEIKN